MTASRRSCSALAEPEAGAQRVDGDGLGAEWRGESPGCSLKAPTVFRDAGLQREKGYTTDRPSPNIDSYSRALMAWAPDRSSNSRVDDAGPTAPSRTRSIVTPAPIVELFNVKASPRMRTGRSTDAEPSNRNWLCHVPGSSG